MFYLLGYSSYVSAPPSGSLLSAASALWKKRDERSERQLKGEGQSPRARRTLTGSTGLSTKAPRSRTGCGERSQDDQVPPLYSYLSRIFSLVQPNVQQFHHAGDHDEHAERYHRWPDRSRRPRHLIILIPISTPSCSRFSAIRATWLNATTRTIIGFCLCLCDDLRRRHPDVHDDSIIWCPGKILKTSLSNRFLI